MCVDTSLACGAPREYGKGHIKQQKRNSECRYQGMKIVALTLLTLTLTLTLTDHTLALALALTLTLTL